MLSLAQLTSYGIPHDRAAVLYAAIRDLKKVTNRPPELNAATFLASLSRRSLNAIPHRRNSFATLHKSACFVPLFRSISVPSTRGERAQVSLKNETASALSLTQRDHACLPGTDENEDSPRSPAKLHSVSLDERSDSEGQPNTPIALINLLSLSRLCFFQSRAVLLQGVAGPPVCVHASFFAPLCFLYS